MSIWDWTSNRWISIDTKSITSKNPYPVTLLRAKLVSTEDHTQAPSIGKIGVFLSTNPALEAVLTTVPYTPPFATILGASVLE